MAESECIWDTVSRVATDRPCERTTANSLIDRKQVSFELGACDLIESEWNVPHLANANGGEVFIYPGFILFYISAAAFALVEASQAEITFRVSPFIEEEAIPSDTRILRHAWKKANKDGSPDGRFVGNYQIPVVAYGGLIVTSLTGLNEEYMLSNAPAVEQFAMRWAEFRKQVLTASANVPPLAANVTPDLAQNGDQGVNALENLGLYGKSLTLATQKPRGWEYLLFTQIVIDEAEKAKRALLEKCVSRLTSAQAQFPLLAIS